MIAVSRFNWACAQGVLLDRDLGKMYFQWRIFFFFLKLLSEVNRNQRRRASLQKGVQSLIHHTLILKLYVRSREVNWSPRSLKVKIAKLKISHGPILTFIFSNGNHSIQYSAGYKEVLNLKNLILNLIFWTIGQSNSIKKDIAPSL